MNDASGAVHYCYRALVAQENRDGGQAAQWLATGIALHEDEHLLQNRYWLSQPRSRS